MTSKIIADNQEIIMERDSQVRATRIVEKRTYKELLILMREKVKTAAMKNKRITTIIISMMNELIL